MMVAMTSSYSAWLNNPLSVRRFKLLSHAAIMRMLSFCRPCLPGISSPRVSASARRSPMEGVSLSISSRNSVPPIASSSLPGTGCPSLSNPPKNSSKSTSSGPFTHFTTISGAAARGLAW